MAEPTKSPYQARLDVLRQLGELQSECATKARQYRQDLPELAGRFDRASFAAINARILMQAAIMAEREAGKLP